jgi:hypothetical protein
MSQDRLFYYLLGCPMKAKTLWKKAEAGKADLGKVQWANQPC